MWYQRPYRHKRQHPLCKRPVCCHTMTAPNPSSPLHAYHSAKHAREAAGGHSSVHFGGILAGAYHLPQSRHYRQQRAKHGYHIRLPHIQPTAFHPPQHPQIPHEVPHVRMTHRPKQMFPYCSDSVPVGFPDGEIPNRRPKQPPHHQQERNYRLANLRVCGYVIATQFVIYHLSFII